MHHYTNIKINTRAVPITITIKTLKQKKKKDQQPQIAFILRLVNNNCQIQTFNFAQCGTDVKKKKITIYRSKSI